MDCRSNDAVRLPPIELRSSERKFVIVPMAEHSLGRRIHREQRMERRVPFGFHKPHVDGYRHLRADPGYSEAADARRLIRRAVLGLRWMQIGEG